MKEYILSLLPRLSKFSKGLNNSAILVDQPWIFLNEQGQQTKFVFRPNQELLVSINGAVQKGRWEYLTTMDALLIDHGNQTQLFSQAFIDKGVLVLNRDNTTDLFVLINSNLIPDLDVVKYLGKIAPPEIEHPKDRDYIIVNMLRPAIQVRVYPKKTSRNNFELGNRVKKIDGSNIDDGMYIWKDSTQIIIKNGLIVKESNPTYWIIIVILLILGLILLYFEPV